MSFNALVSYLGIDKYCNAFEYTTQLLVHN